MTPLDSTRLRALESRVDPVTRGDPPSPLRWTCKRTRTLAAARNALGHRVGERTVARLRQDRGSRVPANRTTQEGAAHPERDAQCHRIHAQTKACQQRGQPVVSVDAQQKARVGDVKNGGRAWQPTGVPERVRVPDFEEKELGKVIPDGISDVTAHTGWVSVGTDHATATVAVATLRRWWCQMGARAYPEASALRVMADGGGRHRSRTRVWKAEWHGLADELGMRLAVCHVPPGTSKRCPILGGCWCRVSHDFRD